MTNYKEIIRLHSLGLNKTRSAESCGCARSTVITALHKAEENGLSWNAVKNLSSEEVTRKLYPATSMGQQYSMPDYEWVHKEMQKIGVTLSLLWVEYCERCRQNGELPYKSTQFNKYYADYVHKTKATMHLEHKPSENLQVDWAGQTAGITDTDTGERLPAYLFVAVLPYSGYAYGRPNQYSTLEEHMPPEHTAYLQWNSEWFLRWASSIGENTAAVVRVFLTAHKVEQQGYNPAWPS